MWLPLAFILIGAYILFGLKAVAWILLAIGGLGLIGALVQNEGDNDE